MSEESKKLLQEATASMTDAVSHLEKSLEKLRAGKAKIHIFFNLLYTVH